MAETLYRVGADFKLRTGNAVREAQRLSGQMRELGGRINGGNTAAASMVRNVVGLGAAYLGLRAIVGTFASLTRGAIQYQNELQKTKIGLAAVLQAVEGGSFAAAADKAGQVFQQLRTDAVRSVATTQELFTIYQSILGPIRAAGFELGKVRDITNSTVSAATALGVDLAQATRDIGLMVRGQAGMDTRLFAILRSTGAIAETTEEWNKNLTQTQRVNKLEQALSKFAPAAEAYAKSWAGVTSTFKDIRQQLTASVMGPLFDRMGQRLEGINQYILDNWTTLTARAERMGVKIADAFDRVFGVAARVFGAIANNWDTIALRIEAAAKAAGHAALLYGAGQVAGAALGSAGAIGSMMGAGTTGAAAAAAPGIAGSMMMGAGAARYASIGGGEGMGAVPLSALMGESAPASALSGALGTLTIALAAAAGAVLVVKDHWSAMTRIFESSTGGLLGEIVGMFSALGDALAPLIKIIGQGALMVLVPTLALLAGVLREVVHGWKLIFEVLATGTNWLYDRFKPGWDNFWNWLAGTLQSFFNISLQASQQWAEQQRQITSAQENVMADLAKQLGIGGGEAPRASAGNMNDWQRATPIGVPKGRVTTVNDFRGSKIEVKQDFRDADPDRVLVQMINGIQRQAELRIQSGFAPALTR